MGFDIGTLGMEAAGGAIGAGMGLLLEGHNDKRQVKQQERLQNLQMRGQKEMAEYQTRLNQESQLAMWKETSYEAQRREMEKAGINPALLYGMSGGGAQTVGGGAMSGNVSGATANGVTNETGMGIQQGMQQAMMLAQIENIKADTNKKNTEAGFTGGVGTDEARKRIENMTQGIEESKEKTRLTEHLANIQDVNDRIAHNEDVQIGMMQQIVSAGEKAKEEVQTMMNNNQLTENNWDALNNEIQTRVGTAKIAQILMQTQNAKTLSDIQVNYATIQKLYTDISTAKNRVEMDKIMNQFKIDHPGMDALESGTIQQVIDATGMGNKYKFKQSK